MKLTACMSCCLAAGLGGVALLIAPSPSTAGPQVSGVPAGPVRANPVAGGRTAPRSDPKRIHDDGSIAGAGGAACQYENLRVGQTSWGAQKASDFPFYAETADDFVLSDPDDPDGQNPCLLDSVTFAVDHSDVGIDPSFWEGVKITIYQDRGVVCANQSLDPPCLRNPDKGPGGYPVATTDPDLREHQPCCLDPTKGAIVCELKVPMSKVTWVPIPNHPLQDVYEIHVFGLDQYNCELQKNKKYWIAPAPVMQFAAFGQTFALTSPNPSGHEAQLIFPVAGFDAWSQIQTQAGSVDRDLYLAVSATKAPPPPACDYENLVLSGLLPDTTTTASQKSTATLPPIFFPFYVETADDFIMIDPDDPDAENICRLDEVQFAVFHQLPHISPQNWLGVKITLYRDRGVVCAGMDQAPQCLRNPDKGPAGYPELPGPDGQRTPHGLCCPQPSEEAIVCELKVPMSSVSWNALPGFPPGAYEIIVTGLRDQFDCIIQKNKKYWIAPAAVMDIVDAAGNNQGFVFLFTSPNPSGHEAQNQLGAQPWSQIGSQLLFPETDLYLAVRGAKAPPPPPPPACHYENLRLSNQMEPAFVVNSQKHYDSTFFPPFYAEAADDFVLTDPDDPNGTNPCRLDEVVFAVQHEVPTVSPANWDGVKITVYQDRGNVCQGQPQAAQCLINSDKGPGGYPLATDNPDARDHDPCCLDPTKEAIVCELKVPMSQVAWVPLATPFENSYEITVFGLRDMFVCDLQKNKKYWLAPAPVMNAFDSAGNLQGGTYLYTSPNAIDHEAQVISEPFGFFEWLRLGTQIPFPETDLYLGISANKVPSCPWDCADFDGQVGIGEFLAVLARWGPSPGNPCDFDGDGVIGINEFLKVLGMWGPCP